MASSEALAEPKLVPALAKNFDLAGIKKEEIDVTRLMSSPDNHSMAFTLKNVFTPTECENFIKITEKLGYTIVPVNYGGIEVVNQDERSGSRTMVDDEEFAEELWKRIEPHIPKKLMGAEVVGLNERFRFLKYNSKQFFKPHWDGCYSRPYNNLEKSLVTIQMYLNENFEGGETTFLYPGHKDTPVKPETGMVLVFTQDLLHEGSVVKSGEKYTVRTDIMYRYGKI